MGFALRLSAICLFTCAAAAQSVSEVTNSDPIQLEVDAQDAPRHLIHVRETIPVTAGPLTLLYPQWIPGEHGPTGPIADVVNLKLQANGESVPWKRDELNMFALNLMIPGGVSVLNASFDFISPPEGVAAVFSGGASMTSELAVISWNQYVLYPKDSPVDRLMYRAKLRLPNGWRYATALPVEREESAGIEFQPVALSTLIDSPVSAGAHARTVDLGTIDGARHLLHIVADNERDLAITPEQIAKYQRLIAEAGALFGTRHYRDYHFLVTLSDHVSSFGLEHHESSDDRLEERFFLDKGVFRIDADLLAHEFVHSWNGKYRRPSGLVTKNYNEPMRDDLLWVYEGLTEYLGQVLATRAGLEAPEQFREWLAELGGMLDRESGREWRPLSDTAVAAQVLYGGRDDYSSLRRGTDFYGEAALVWLEVDTVLRTASHGTKSIDDFCRLFFGGEGGGPSVKPYTLDELAAALNSIQLYDWARLFDERVNRINKHAPSAGIENAGWKIAFADKRGETWAALEEQHKLVDLALSLGVVVKADGLVQDVAMGGPAQKVGVVPGARITAVNGRRFSTQDLREAVRVSSMNTAPIELTQKNGESSSVLSIGYYGGEKYPVLEREHDKQDLLTLIGTPKSR